MPCAGLEPATELIKSQLLTRGVYTSLGFLGLSDFCILRGHFKFGQMTQKWSASVVTFAVTPSGDKNLEELLGIWIAKL